MVWTDGRSALEARRRCFSSSVLASSIWQYQVAFETEWGCPKLCLRQRHTYSIDCWAVLEAMGEELVDVERDRAERNAECVHMYYTGVWCVDTVCLLRMLHSVKQCNQSM